MSGQSSYSQQVELEEVLPSLQEVELVGQSTLFGVKQGRRSKRRLLSGGWRRGLVTFVLATLLVQGVILFSGGFLSGSLPGNNVLAPGLLAPGQAHSSMEDRGDYSNMLGDLRSSSYEDELFGFAENLDGEERHGEEEVPHARVVTHTVQAGDTLTSIWRSYAPTASGGILAAEAFKEVGLAPNAIRRGELLEIQLSAGGDITAFQRRLDDGKVLLLDGDSQFGYAAQIIEPKIIEEEKTVVGEISNSFVQSAVQLEVPYEVVDTMVDLLSAKVNFRRDLKPGDRFSLIYTERRLENGEVLRPGQVRAASLEVNGKKRSVVLYQPEGGEAAYYDEAGGPIGDYFLRYPLQFSRISSVFTDNRMHPILGVNRPHHGVDLVASTGTPVRSVADGVVAFSGWNGGAGRMVTLKHGGRYSTQYLHLSRISGEVKKGATVKRGQVIGAVGATGLATGPHLCFRLLIDGRYVDPLNVELPRMPHHDKPIPEALLASTLAELEASLEKLQVASIVPSNGSRRRVARRGGGANGRLKRTG